MRSSTASRLATTLFCVIAAVLITGCTDLRLRSLGSGGQEISPTGFADLDPEERERLSEVLEGEIQTVYTSDIGLARVNGQVANFSDESYEAVRFEIVADLKASSMTDEGTLAEGSVVTEVVGTFVLADFAPGDIDTFDVQTTVRAGDTRSLRVQVSGVR